MSIKDLWKNEFVIPRSNSCLEVSFSQASFFHCLSKKKLILCILCDFFQGFFEEVEDLKYALQQAARLNSAYEKALKQLCSQYGLSFPKITTTAPTKRHRKRSRSQAREFTSQ